jgi:hypothetical protein
MFKLLLQSLIFRYQILFNRIIRNQRINPSEIPIIIINYNQFKNLKIMVDFFVNRGMKKIIIIDNNSDYPPLLEYYKSCSKEEITIEIMPKNLGHMVFFENNYLQKKYAKGYYFLTDPDILPNPNLPQDFVSHMIHTMDKYNHKITKVGFALDLDSIPHHYPLKTKVIDWESKYWEEMLDEDTYSAPIDTTFALYKPKFPKYSTTKGSTFYKAIRLAGNFTAKHMGWYVDPSNLSIEEKNYFNKSTASNSWKFDKDGNLDSPSNY